MHENYEIFGYSVPYLSKERNGDCFLIEFLSEEKILLTIVADGVSKQPCDWLASQIVCTQLSEFFKQNKSNSNISNRLIDSILQTNDFILNIEGACRKMASTLSVIVWQIETEKLFWANVGDSRIYSAYKGEITQLTKDDAIIRQEKVMGYGGMRLINQSILTKVMGQENLQITVNEYFIKKDEIIILASDGFYEARKSIFSKTIAELSLQENLKENFDKIVQDFEMMTSDDLTVVMLKRKE